MSPPRGGQFILSAIEVDFASRSISHLTGRSRVFISFLHVPCVPCAAKWPLVLWQPFARRVLGNMLRRCTASTPVSSSFKWHHFVDRSALFTNSFRRHRDIVSAKQKRSAASLNLPEVYFTCELPNRSDVRRDRMRAKYYSGHTTLFVSARALFFALLGC
jgi:hypothetical protein